MVRENLKKEIKKIRSDFFKTVSTLVVSAFGFVAALAWNNAIVELINKYLAPGKSLWSWFIYAILVTILAVLITVYLGRLAEKHKEEEEK